MASMIRKDKEGGRTVVIYKSSIIYRMTILYSFTLLMTQKKCSIKTNLLNQKHATGVVSELKATQFLIKNGFLVFTNTS